MLNQDKLISKNDVDDFEKNGILVIKNFYDLECDILPIQLDIYNIIALLIDQYKLQIERTSFSPESFDSGFNALIAQNRSYGGIIYDAVKQIPSFVRLASSLKHEQLFRELRQCAFPAFASGGYGIRIDNPHEEKYRANWHQEYPAQLRSVDGLVFWTPLLKVTKEMGPVEFCIGSHKEGPLPVYTFDKHNPNKTGAYALKIKDEENILAKYPHVSPLTEPGDLVIIDFLVLHASGYNMSYRSRWSMQFRYFNFKEPRGLTNGWRGSYNAGIDFRLIHPELCAD